MSESAPEVVFVEPEEAPEVAAPESAPDAEPQPSPEEPQGQPVLGPDGYPLSTPVADMAPEHQAAYWRYQSKKHEKAARTNSDAAKRWSEFEDSQKTEQQKLRERAEAAEQSLVEERQGRARLMAAATYNLPADLLDRLGGATDEEINDGAQALSQAIETEVTKRLPALVEAQVEAEVAKRLEQHEQEPQYSAAGRPVESLTPGAMPASRGPADNNEWLRRMAGFA